jgi:hypothetical protein
LEAPSMRAFADRIGCLKSEVDLTEAVIPSAFMLGHQTPRAKAEEFCFG